MRECADFERCGGGGDGEGSGGEDSGGEDRGGEDRGEDSGDGGNATHVLIQSLYID